VVDYVAAPSQNGTAGPTDIQTVGMHMPSGSRTKHYVYLTHSLGSTIRLAYKSTGKGPLNLHFLASLTNKLKAECRNVREHYGNMKDVC
jgi:hypothetical protein